MIYNFKNTTLLRVQSDDWNIEIIRYICNALDYNIEDIMEHVSDIKMKITMQQNKTAFETIKRKKCRM